MTDTIRIGDQWYVAAHTAMGDAHPQVLKGNETFGLFDRFGDIGVLGGEQGLYHADTRFLSREELRIDGVQPMYLGSTVQENNNLLTIDLMNPQLGDDEHSIPQGTLHIFRAKLLWDDACHEHIRLNNHGSDTMQLELSIEFDADFVDLFEVRGTERERRGEKLPEQVGRDHVLLSYRGLDDAVRKTRVHFEPVPSTLAEHRAEFALQLAPGEEQHLYVTVLCGIDATAAAPRPHDYDHALAQATQARDDERERTCVIETSNPLVNLWLERSVADLAMLTTRLPTGPYPYAGVPWYSTTFGRDGLITARECLWLHPALGRGVLAFLAATQADRVDETRDAEPGKILHEARHGEMAATGEIPFGHYYGSVDATPLFVGLLAAWHRATGDLDFVRELWPNVQRALEWMDRYGDVDGDGFVEYERHSSNGLQQQGWKDSVDSIFHADGRLAEPPIALCEVQGYVYEAKLGAAGLARRLGDHALAERLDHEARALREKFQQAFWCDEIGAYALALDGAKRPCKVLASNAGHALWSGIASDEHAGRTAASLLGANMYNGFGIRTIGSGQARFNPMSYHDGSVWPHDNALCAIGMARYGRTAEAMRVFAGLFDASLYFEQHRLPELFCGFERRPSEGPILYPVACAPQAWASAAVFGMLHGCLGLDIRAEQSEVHLRRPRLPSSIEWLRLTRLAVGRHHVDLLLQRYQDNGVGVEVTRKEGPVSVIVSV